MGIAAKIVLESDGTLIRRVCYQRLEGSRFGPGPADLANFTSSLVPPKHAKAGGSRERPNGFAALWPGVNVSEPQVNASRWVIPGSRLLRHFRSGWRCYAKFARWPRRCQSGLPDVASRSLRRRGEVWLPSRRWAIAHHISAPPLSRTTTNCDPASPSSSPNDPTLARLNERDQILQFR